VAEVGGICPAHARVIRGRPDKVPPEFLPFLMMSDRFTCFMGASRARQLLARVHCP
jgi:hypothetical protein